MMDNDTQVELLSPGHTFSVPVSQLTPDTVEVVTRRQQHTFSSLSAASLMSSDQRYTLYFRVFHNYSQKVIAYCS